MELKEWNVNWINKTGSEKQISGIFKATSNDQKKIVATFFAILERCRLSPRTLRRPH